MNYDEVLQEHDAKAFIELLSETYKVRKPKVAFTGRKRGRGMYFPRKKTIRVARETLVWVLVHEFTHYLDHVVTGRTDYNGGEWHSQGFYYKLRNLTAQIGGSYPWNREYRQLYRWAKSDGLQQ